MSNSIKVKDKAMILLDVIKENLSQLEEKEVEQFIEILKSHKSNKLLIMGAGRSGLVGGAFAMRLLHLGFNAFVLGDTIVPSIDKDDLVIAISGSGSTKLIVTAAQAAQQVGAKIVSLTSYPSSPLAKLSTHTVFLKGRMEVSTKDYFARQILGLHEPLAPLGTVFEDSAMLLLDSVIASLMAQLNVEEAEMRKRYANIE
ncbi:MAG: 6-phospho-3-hexuloisomerase [Nitrososphaeria archaeon]|jgi:6-phospho-3-hexuloisomerase